MKRSVAAVHGKHASSTEISDKFGLGKCDPPPLQIVLMLRPCHYIFAEFHRKSFNGIIYVAVFGDFVNVCYQKYICIRHPTSNVEGESI